MKNYDFIEKKLFNLNSIMHFIFKVNTTYIFLSKIKIIQKDSRNLTLWKLIFIKNTVTKFCFKDSDK